MGHGLRNTNWNLAPTCSNGHCLYMSQQPAQPDTGNPSPSPIPIKQPSFTDLSQSNPEKIPFGPNLHLSVSFCKLSQVNKEKRKRNIATSWSKRGKTLEFTHTEVWSIYLMKAFCLDSRYFLIYNSKTGLKVKLLIVFLYEEPRIRTETISLDKFIG